MLFQGCAVILQGRHIEHQALRALGATERITMVTSFRPKSHNVQDDTVLTTVRPISNLSELYFQFSEYRLEILEERIRTQLKALRENETRGKKMNTKALKCFLREQELFLAHMSTFRFLVGGFPPNPDPVVNREAGCRSVSLPKHVS